MKLTIFTNRAVGAVGIPLKASIGKSDGIGVNTTGLDLNSPRELAGETMVRAHLPRRAANLPADGIDDGHLKRVAVLGGVGLLVLCHVDTTGACPVSRIRLGCWRRSAFLAVASLYRGELGMADGHRDILHVLETEFLVAIDGAVQVASPGDDEGTSSFALGPRGHNVKGIPIVIARREAERIAGWGFTRHTRDVDEFGEALHTAEDTAWVALSGCARRCLGRCRPPVDPLPTVSNPRKE